MRKGFTILEFLAVCLLLLAASTILLPRALQPRMAVNEEHAVGYLAMIAAGERAWKEETGAYVPFHRLSEEPPIARRSDTTFTTRAPLLAPEFLVDHTGVAHRGGFRFRLARGEDGAPTGCWAWPNLRGFSGEHAYWADFASGEIRRLREKPPWPAPPDVLPTAADLATEILMRF
jgi:type II secretory pathway pseudopilin PulG